MVIDLQTAGWPPLQLPYLSSLHCSAITCSHHVSNIPLKLWERIIAAGSRQNAHFSTMVGPPLPRVPALLLSGSPGTLSPLSLSRSGPSTAAPAWPQPHPSGTCCSQGK